MHLELPSNKIGGLFIVIVLVVVLVISGDVVLEKLGQTNNGTEIIDGELYLSRNTTDDSSVDTDKDGLLDWQETLYKSNANISDTDGDGTSDGDEIKEGRDPSLAGPNDKLVKFGDLLDTDFNVDYKANSFTGNLSVELLANYLSMKKSNVYDAETAQTLTNDLADKASLSVGLTETFTTSKMKTVETNSASLFRYGSEFASIQNESVRKMKSIVETDDYKYVEEVVENYKRLAQTLSLMDVPSNVANTHVQIINKIYNEGLLMEELNNYNSDPVKGLFAIQKIKENSNGTIELYKTLANYFVDNDIIFTDNEIIRFWNTFK